MRNEGNLNKRFDREFAWKMSFENQHDTALK